MVPWRAVQLVASLAMHWAVFQALLQLLQSMLKKSESGATFQIFTGDTCMYWPKANSITKRGMPTKESMTK
ncbi:hypothetical protein TYRP_016274 [Tyrophagus putrescentiae]|nr:hypothetical protein TYRP_016274 [Tyrophagus putrescentiae]